MLPRFAVFAGILLFCLSCSAAPTAAKLTGRIADPSGAPIAGAQVSAREVNGPGNYQTTTSADGTYALALPPGRYRVRIADTAFAAVTRTIAIAAGAPARWSPQLPLRPLAATVTVTAGAQPLPLADATGLVDVVTAREIGQRHQLWLAPLLASLPGLSLEQLGPEGGITSLFMDGGNSNFTKVLVDGTPVNEPGGNVDFSNYTLDNVEKIEVVHGATSALFGSDAMVGVIQIFTRRGATRRPEIDFHADGGNFSTWHAGGDVSGLLGKLDYSAGIDSIATQGQGPNDRFRDNSLSGDFGWHFSPANSLRLALRSSASDAGVAGQTLFLPYDPHQHDALKNVSANLAWDFQTGSRWRHHLAASESYLGETYTDPPIYTTRNEYNRAGFEEQSSYLFGKGGLTAGYEAEVENGYFGGTHARRNNQAGYLEARVQPTRRLTAVAGARVEDNAGFGTRVVPRLGLSLVVREGSRDWGPTHAYASYGLGIKEPTFDQSFSADPCFPGNAGLRPERSRTLDAGVDQILAGDRVRVSIDGFRNEFYDMVSFGFGAVTPACPYGTGTFYNTDRSRAFGGNAQIEARPGRWLTLIGNYTYDDTLVLSAPNAFDPSLLPGNRLFLRPPHSANFLANVSTRRMDWDAEAEFVGRRTDSDFLGLGLTSVPSYFVVNLGTSYRLGAGATAYARADNVLNRHYQIALGYPALRLGYRVGVRYRWGGGR